MVSPCHLGSEVGEQWSYSKGDHWNFGEWRSEGNRPWGSCEPRTRGKKYSILFTLELVRIHPCRIVQVMVLYAVWQAKQLRAVSWLYVSFLYLDDLLGVFRGACGLCTGVCDGGSGQRPDHPATLNHTDRRAQRHVHDRVTFKGG